MSSHVVVFMNNLAEPRLNVEDVYCVDVNEGVLTIHSTFEGADLTNVIGPDHWVRYREVEND